MTDYKIFGKHDDATIAQLDNCVRAEDGARGVLCADGHLGYSMPIGGVVGYKKFVSPSGVGYDIACGNYAVQTDIQIDNVPVSDWERIADEMFARISFGVGRKNDEPVDDPVFDMIRESPVPAQRGLLTLAQSQLGTVGSGNHYVDLLTDARGYVWIACHFGSRGFGHKTASMFMNVAQGLPMDSRSHDGEMMSPPLLLHIDNPIGQDYIDAMSIAGEYAYAGRRHVIDRVLQILGNPDVHQRVHNHHNFAWKEEHFGEHYWVVRKGATPAFPGQQGFIGGNMDDMCVIVSGLESAESRAALRSTVHGAGRVMSRNAAIKGKHKWVCCEWDSHYLEFVPPAAPPKDMRCPQCRLPLKKVFTTSPVCFTDVQARVKEHGVILRGAGPDESPECYRPLRDVLAAHKGTISIDETLKPFVVCMASKDVRDPYKD